MNRADAAARAPGAEWRAAARAGVLYVLVVFAIAFVIGSVRVLWVAPRLGAFVAVLLESPLVLAASWGSARWSIRRLEVANALRIRAAMGTTAFVTLMLVEYGVAVWAFGASQADYLAQLRTPPGADGLLTRLCFAAIPCVQTLVRRRELPS